MIIFINIGVIDREIDITYESYKNDSQCSKLYTDNIKKIWDSLTMHISLKILECNSNK